MGSAPKYMDIVDWAAGQIASGAFLPGDRFLSESALGERFGFSRQTVRRALEVLEQRGQIARVQGSGTYIAGGWPSAKRSPGNGGSMPATVGVVSLHLDDYIYPGIIRGIEGVLTAGGYGVLLASTQNEVAGEGRALQRMLANNLAGLIIEPTKSGLPCVNEEHYRAIAQRGIPFVFTDSRYQEVDAPFVALDDVAVGYVATKHLIDLGHRRVAGVFTHSNRPGQLRYRGYMKALEDHGLPLREDMVHWFCHEDMEETLQGGRLWNCLAQSTAVVCYNDMSALMLIDLLRSRGRRVPEDLSVVAVDNTELARVSDLTSVVHPGERLGEAAAKLLIAMIGGAEGRTILFPPQLVARGSARRVEGAL